MLCPKVPCLMVRLNHRQGRRPSPLRSRRRPRNSASAAGDSAAPVKRAYPAPAEVPTQEGPKGLRFDFNDGCRVVLPESEHPWRVRLSDLDTGNILFETEIKAGRINSSKRYYVRFRRRGLAAGRERVQP